MSSAVISSRQILGGYGCTVLLAIFFAWCAWRGRKDGEENGPEL